MVLGYSGVCVWVPTAGPQYLRYPTKVKPIGSFTCFGCSCWFFFFPGFIWSTLSFHKKKYPLKAQGTSFETVLYVFVSRNAPDILQNLLKPAMISSVGFLLGLILIGLLLQWLNGLKLLFGWFSH